MLTGSGLGSAGAVGGSGQYKSSAAASNSLGRLQGDAGAGGAGNRGFINNFAAAGASLNADQGINPPLVGGKLSNPLLWVGVAAVALLFFKRK